MQTLLYPRFEALEIAEAPIPEPRRDEVLLRVAACGLCGSELEAFRNRSPRRVPPLVLGHEFCGTIAKVGALVDGWEPGQQVVSNSLVPCLNCVRCRRDDTHLCAQRQIFGMQRPGAFAEYVAVPASCLLPWPEEVPATAACLAEPLGNGIHMTNLVRHNPPETVLVLGCGPIGLMAMQAFRRLLGSTIWAADLSPARREVAKQLGATEVFDPREMDVPAAVRDLTAGEGADCVVDAVGSQITKRQSLEALRPGGTALWIGLHQDEVTLDTYGITLPEKLVQGTYGVTMDELSTALDMMRRGEVDLTSWTHLFPLSEGVEAFHRMLAAQGADIKAVLLPPQ